VIKFVHSGADTLFSSFQDTVFGGEYDEAYLITQKQTCQLTSQFVFISNHWYHILAVACCSLLSRLEKLLALMA
jgi:hypothetical protein